MFLIFNIENSIIQPMVHWHFFIYSSCF